MSLQRTSQISLRLAAVSIVAVLLVYGSAQPTPSTSIEDLPEEILFHIISLIRTPKDLGNVAISSKQLGAIARRLLKIREQFDFVIPSLSKLGEYEDQAWLHLAIEDPKDLWVPPLPDDFPQDLLQFINKCLPVPEPFTPNDFVNRIRDRYPPELRNVFPHCHRIANAILADAQMRKYLTQVRILRYLGHYGIGFYYKPYWECIRAIQEDIDQGVVNMVIDDAILNRNSLVITKMLLPICIGRHDLINALVVQGRSHVIPELLVIATFQKAFVSVMESEYNSGVIPALEDCIPYITRAAFRDIMNEVVARFGFKEEGHEEFGLRHLTVLKGRIDLFELLITEFGVPPEDHDAIGEFDLCHWDIIDYLPHKPECVIDFIALSKHVIFKTYLDKNVERLFLHWCKLAFERNDAFFRAIFQDRIVFEYYLLAGERCSESLRSHFGELANDLLSKQLSEYKRQRCDRLYQWGACINDKEAALDLAVFLDDMEKLVCDSGDGKGLSCSGLLNPEGMPDSGDRFASLSSILFIFSSFILLLLSQ